MSRFLPGALVAAVLLCLGPTAPAAAAALRFAPNPAVGFSLIGAVEIVDDGGDLRINNAFGSPLESFGVPGLTDDAFDLLIVGDSLSAPPPSASLFIDGVDGSVAGDLLDFAATDGFVELLFGVTTDDFGLFGAHLLVAVAGDFSAGLDATDASITVNPATVIPLPATLPLLAGALAVMAAARRRRG